MAMSWHLPAEISAAKREALEVGGRMLLDNASAVAPRRSGALVESGYVEVRDDDTVRVGYSAAHATKQHFRQDFEHPGGGQAMFLSDTAGDFGPEFQEVAADVLRRRLGG